MLWLLIRRAFALAAALCFIINECLYTLELTNIWHISDENNFVLALFVVSTLCIAACGWYFKGGVLYFKPDIKPTTRLRYSAQIITLLCIAESLMPFVLFKYGLHWYSNPATSAFTATGVGSLFSWVSAVIFIMDREGLFSDRQLTFLICPFSKGGYPARKRLYTSDYSKILKDIDDATAETKQHKSVTKGRYNED